MNSLLPRSVGRGQSLPPGILARSALYGVHETARPAQHVSQRERSISGEHEVSHAERPRFVGRVSVLEPDIPDTNRCAPKRIRSWKLRFRRERAPWADPLTGWCSGDDPEAHITLKFPTEEAALAFAQRTGLTVQGSRNGWGSTS
ncbi:NADH dehydrogenase ubiquinone Fe-S protein 4 [Erythrobacter longus]|uniref:NADH dehydrogenase ubiquinone Fe-S protein 4 n=1 Tax=Erythrobacter longus TaxID=1044 RepID=UPI0009DD5CCA|nr:NADH dehydrogenase ubiquinone Fe-S protein 4 [Erythrobacter longus]